MYVNINNISKITINNFLKYIKYFYKLELLLAKLTKTSLVILISYSHLLLSHLANHPFL